MKSRRASAAREPEALEADLRKSAPLAPDGHGLAALAADGQRLAHPDGQRPARLAPDGRRAAALAADGQHPATVTIDPSGPEPRGRETIDAQAARQDRRRWVALAVIVVAQFMVVLDVAIVNVALPSIRTDLNFSQESLQWVITAYAIFFGGVLLLGGRLADLIGRRRMFLTGLGLFTVASLLDGIAWSAGSLIVFRSVQGLGAALLSPAALSILTTTFREGRERNVALGIWGAASGSGGAAGVLLGGALTSGLSWSWIFFLNVPIGILLFAVSPALLPESRADLRHRHLDVGGAVSITAGLMLLVYAMTRATQHGWGTPGTIGLLVGSGALIGAFFAIEARSQAPLLPLRIFRLRTLTASNVSGLLMGGAIFSQFFLLTLYMQQVLHYSALRTGVAYIGLTLSIITFSAVGQAAVTRFGIRPVLPIGLGLSTVALVLFAQLPVHGDYFTDLFPAFLLSGVGLALAFVPMSIGALTGVRPADAGVASGLINTTQQIGGAIGVALATTIATTVTSHYVQGHPGTTPMTGAALTHGFEIAFYVLAGLAALGAVLAAILLESRPAQPEPQPVEPPMVDLRAAGDITPPRAGEAGTLGVSTRAGVLGRAADHQPAEPGTAPARAAIVVGGREMLE